MRTKRETPLDICPDLDCVRSGQCRARRPEQKCRKFHMTVDERRIQIAEQLEAILAEDLAKNPGRVMRDMSDEDVRYEARKALAEVLIQFGKRIPSSMIPPDTGSDHLRKLREESDRLYGRKGVADTPPLDQAERTS